MVRLLRSSQSVAVRSMVTTGDVAMIELESATVRAGIVAARDRGPVEVSRRGKKRYGTYTLAGVGYGDWIKGDNASECAAYVVAWFVGAEARAAGSTGARHAFRVPLWALGDGEVESAPDLPAIGEELQARSSLRSGIGAGLRSDQGDVKLGVDAGGSIVVAVVGSLTFEIEARSDGVRVAGLLGALDGYAPGSDD